MAPAKPHEPVNAAAAEYTAATWAAEEAQMRWAQIAGVK